MGNMSFMTSEEIDNCIWSLLSVCKGKKFECDHMPYFSYKIPNFSTKLALKILIFVSKISPNFLSKSAGQPANDHWGMANLDHRGIAGRIYVRNHLTLLHTVSSGPYGFSEEAFWRFFNYIQFYINIWCLGCDQFEPQGLDWQDLCRGSLNMHDTL